LVFSWALFQTSSYTYYNFGKLPFLNLTYIEPGFAGHFALGLFAVLGILVLRRRESKKKVKAIGLWTRSERMFLFFGFAAYGIIIGFFSRLLLYGILVLTLFTYISILKRAPSKKRPAYKTPWLSRGAKKIARGLLNSTSGLIKAVLKTGLKTIGVLLLGVYIALEKTTRFLSKMFVWLTALRIKGGGNESARAHPPIKPFEGTISPPPSTLPDPSREPFSRPPTSDEMEALNHPEYDEATSTIELPPPDYLLEPDDPYTGGGAVGESLLVFYEPVAKKETVLIDIVDFMMSEGKDMVIVSSEPTASQYKERFKGIAGIRVIDLSDPATIPSRDQIPVTNLEYFSEVFEDLSDRNVFVFEPLSNLVLHVGVAQAYRFISQTINRLSKKGVTFISFLNKEGHDRKDISNFENLFINIANIEEGRLKKVK
jgi:hypothetical protein